MSRTEVTPRTDGNIMDRSDITERLTSDRHNAIDKCNVAADRKTEHTTFFH